MHVEYDGCRVLGGKYAIGGVLRRAIGRGCLRGWRGRRSMNGWAASPLWSPRCDGGTWIPAKAGMTGRDELVDVEEKAG